MKKKASSQKKGYGHKKEEVVNALRGRILSNQYEPGSRLPTVDELVEEFAFSRTTMQQAIRQLTREGFIQTIDRKGVYVTERPPHLHRIGVVFGCGQDHHNWTKFYTAFRDELGKITEPDRHYEFICYYEVNPDLPDSDYKTLRKDIASHSLAGLIIHRSAWDMREELSTLTASAGIPTALVNYNLKEAPGATVIRTNGYMFVDKSMDWFKERDRSRVAVVTMYRIPQINTQAVFDRGLSIRPHWLQAIGYDGISNLGSLIHLLLDYPVEERPDALLIANDHLTDIVLKSIGECGLIIGRDIDVIAHCNWPQTTQSPLPIRRLGFSAQDFIRQCLTAIEKPHDGPHEILIPALFESEVPGMIPIPSPSMKRQYLYAVGEGEAFFV
jgi:DNA-binding LacI/PurR family transcriptional regulator